MTGQSIYKISFVNQGKVYEIYARSVGSSGIFGFIEVAELCFGEKSSIVLDPSEDALRNEFAGVKTTHIPLHSIIRIDEVTRQGKAKATDVQKGEAGNITAFPLSAYNKPDLKNEH